MVVAHVILIRYSLFLEKSGSWKLGRSNTDSIDSYKKSLFDDERLRERINLFKKITLPSLIKQKLSNNSHKLQVFLATSEELPEKHKQELNELAKPYEWLNICYLPSSGIRFQSLITDYIEQLYNQLKEPILYSSIRLDDDDALSSTVLSRLEPYVTEGNIGSAISFANGFFAVYDNSNNCFTQICEYYFPKLALGLALVNRYDESGYSHKYETIYDAGNHVTLDYRIPVIVDSRESSYIRTMHSHADTHSEKRIQAVLNKYNHIHPIKVMKSIGVVFPIVFNNLHLNLTVEDLNKLKLYSFSLKNEGRRLSVRAQMCVWKSNLLIQLTGYNSDQQSIKFILRNNNTVLEEVVVEKGSSLQVVMSLTKYKLGAFEQIKEANIDEGYVDSDRELLFLDVIVMVDNDLKKYTYELTSFRNTSCE